jgi:serine/threonine protein kinase
MWATLFFKHDFVPFSCLYILQQRILVLRRKNIKPWISNIEQGKHTNGETIAVKVLRYIPGVGDEQFEKEYLNLASLQHKNIVRLVGYCNETQREWRPFNKKMVLAEMTQRVLCFEYMRNGSLDKYLFGMIHGTLSILEGTPSVP